jgi:hypothetical protein
MRRVLVTLSILVGLTGPLTAQAEEPTPQAATIPKSVLMFQEQAARLPSCSVQGPGVSGTQVILPYGGLSISKLLAWPGEQPFMPDASHWRWLQATTTPPPPDAPPGTPAVVTWDVEPDVYPATTIVAYGGCSAKWFQAGKGLRQPIGPQVLRVTYGDQTVLYLTSVYDGLNWKPGNDQPAQAWLRTPPNPVTVMDANANLLLDMRTPYPVPRPR